MSVNGRRSIYLTLIFGLVCFYQISTHAAFPVPLLELAGDVRVVMLLDIHKTILTNGTCDELDIEAVQVGQAAVWTYDWIKNEGKKSKSEPISLEIFDTCGSPRVAMEVVSRVVTEATAPTARRLAGVISYSNKETLDQIDAYLGLIGYTHISFLRSEDRLSLEGSGLRVPSAASRRAQALAAAVKQLNWQRVSMVTMDEPHAKLGESEFIKIAADFDICVSSSRTVASIEEMMSVNYTTSGVLAFVGYLPENLTLPIVRSHFNYSFLFSGMEDPPLPFSLNNNNNNTNGIGQNITGDEHSPTNQVFFLTEFLSNSSEQLLEDFSSASFARPKSLQYLQTVFGCGNDRYICKAAVDSYFEFQARYSTIRQGRDGLLGILETTELLQASGCLDFRHQSCDIQMRDLKLTSFGLDTRGTNCQTGLPLSLYSSGADGDIKEVGVFHGDIFKVLDKTVPTGDIVNIVPPSQCIGSCPPCPVCHIGKAKPVPAAISPGTVYLGGLFPTKDTRGRLLSDNILASEAFMWTVKYLQRGNSNLFPDIRVGAFVLDSSEGVSQSQSLISGLDNCAITPVGDSKIHSISRFMISGYLDVPIEDHFSQHVFRSSKPVLGLSKHGIFDHGARSTKVWPQRIASLLKSLQWTYPIIVWSELMDESFRQTFEHKLQSNGVCLALSLSFSTNSMATSRFLKRVNDSKSSVIVLMTTENDTEDFINFYQEHLNNHSSNNFIFNPWNAEAVHAVAKEMLLGSVIIDLRKERNFNFEVHLKESPFSGENLNPWITELYKTECEHKCNNSQATRSCWEAYVENVKSSFPLYMIDATETILLGLKFGFEQKCLPKETGCNFEELLLESFDASKVPFPLDILNIQLSRNGTLITKKVGEFGESGHLNLDVTSVLSYDSSGEITPSISVCGDWCPSCQQCTDASPASDLYYYMPGDVVIVGVFPIHTESKEQGMCGEFNQQGFIDAEAFRYSVGEIHSRYPAIFPNVTIGLLIIDSCGNKDHAIRQIINFETCHETYSRDNNFLNPRMVLGYIDFDGSPVLTSVSDVLERNNRLLLTSSELTPSTDNQNILSTAASNQNITDIVIDLLAWYNWTYVSIITSEHLDHLQQANRFQEMASKNDICVAGVYKITNRPDSLQSAYDGLYRNRASHVVVTFLSGQNSSDFFEIIKNKYLRRVWINAVKGHFFLPEHQYAALGSMGFESPKFVHGPFEEYLASFQSDVDDSLPWYNEFRSISEQTRDEEALDRVVNTISTVDTLLHGFHDLYSKSCPTLSGLCSYLASLNQTAFLKELLSATKMTSFLSDTGRVVSIQKTNCFLPESNYDVTNLKRFDNGTMKSVKVASWDGKLRLVPDEDFEFYDAFGFLRQDKVLSSCRENCQCVNRLASDSGQFTLTQAGVSGDLIFYKTSGEFIREPWAISILAVASFGVFVVFCVFCFILSKLCVRSLRFKNADMGLLLLLANIVLYLSVMPFLFTPSPVGCGLQYLLTSISYALCFGICLTKAMTIYEYSSVGLGGEVSRLNTFIILLFIVSVQVAIGTQFWLTHDNTSMMLTETAMDGTMLYACPLEKRTFVIYLSYVMFLLFLCVLYSFVLRGDKRNMHETKFLFACSVLCVAVWVAWVAVVFVKERDFVEPAICVGIILCATIILLVLFFPKLRHLSNPKHYNLQRDKTKKTQKIQKENGFEFDGPYTLPDSVRTKEKPHANSIVALSSDFFY